MAFTFTKDGENVVGNKRVTWGTWTTDTTSGTIRTGLQKVEFLILTPKSAVSPTEDCQVTTALPANDGIEIGITSGVDGYWCAKGY
jgi:hypothetical protein